MSTTAHANMYDYSGQTFTAVAGVGSPFQNASISFQFSTPNPLPPNLSYGGVGPPPEFNVPVTDWSVSVGPYQANGSGLVDLMGPGFGLYYLMLDTNASGRIPGWLVFLDALTTDGANGLAVVFRSQPPFGDNRTDYVQASSVNGGQSYSAGAYVPGNWSGWPRYRLGPSRPDLRERWPSFLVA